MKVGDLVKIRIESGLEDIGLILDINDFEVAMGDGQYYEVMCQENKTICIATKCMLEVIQ